MLARTKAIAYINEEALAAAGQAGGAGGQHGHPAGGAKVERRALRQVRGPAAACEGQPHAAPAAHATAQGASKRPGTAEANGEKAPEVPGKKQRRGVAPARGQGQYRSAAML